MKRRLIEHRGRRFTFLMCATLVGLASCSANDGEDRANVGADQQAVEPSDATMSMTLGFRLDESVKLEDMAIGALELAQLADRVEVLAATSVAQGRIEVGNDSKTGGLAAQGEIRVGHRTVVSGDVHAGGELKLEPSTKVDGEKSGNLGAKPPKEVTWTVQVPVAQLGPVSLERDQRRKLEPGRYGALSVKSGASVTLSTGVYAFDDVTLEPQGQLLVDDREGPVQIVLNGKLSFKGRVRSAHGSVPQVLFAVQGNHDVMVEAPFVGVLLAPQATVRFQAARPDGHRAVVVGKSVWLEPDTKLRRLPFDWSTLLGPAYENVPEDALVHTMPEDDLGLTVHVPAEGGASTTKTASTPTAEDFTLPEEYTVAGGVIGNGTVVFRYNPGSGFVTCTYRGQSSTSRPETPDELIKGTQLRFEGCSDGLPAGAKRSGTEFEVTVNPSPDYPVTVNPPFQRPNVCNDRLELLSPAQTRALRQSFDWSNAAKVAAYNPDGTPTLYYAWIYVRNKEEALALKRLFIHVLSRPLFDEELTQYAGRCGTFTNPGDGEGAFVPAVIPGATYNRLIDALTSGAVSGDRVIFDAVILRQVPAAARNPNGSINLQTLGRSGFRYLGYESDPFAPNDQIVLDAGVAKALVDALEWVGQAARDVAELVTGALNELDQLFRGEAEVDLWVHVFTGDPLFGGRIMERAWGSMAGEPLGAAGMQVTILQKLFDLPFPSTAQGHTNAFGHVRIDAVDGAATLGTGLCVELRTRAALVTDFLLASEICDLRGYDAKNDVSTQFRLGKISHGDDIDVRVDNTRLIGLYQADDVFRYSTDVMRYTPKRARILSGYWASTFTTKTDSGADRLYTPCLNFPNSVSDMIMAAAIGAGAGAGALVGSVVPGIGTALGSTIGALALGTFGAVVGNSDIVMSPQSRAHDSRGVMSHEYGHYMFCNMIFDANVYAVDHVIWANIVAGDDKTAPVRFMNEAVAEFFESQVASGADYKWLPSEAHSNGGDQYCSSAGVPCWEANLRDDTTGPDKIGRVATLLLDVFDGQGAGRTANVPNDADAWRADKKGELWFNRDPAGDGDDDTALERVALPGDSIRDIAARLAAGMAPFVGYGEDGWHANGHAIDDMKIRKAINDTMLDRGVSWCDRCRVLALHEPGTADRDNVRDLWEICREDADLRTVLGPGPEPTDLRLDANTCTPCPDGFTSNDDGVCVPCANTVVGNECVICTPDVILDGDTLPFELQTFDLTTPTPGDECPHLFVAEVQNADRVFARGADHFDVRLDGAPVSQSSCERSFSLTTTFFDGTGNAVSDVRESVGSFPDCTTGICPDMCGGMPERSVTPAEAAGGTVFFRAPALPDARLEISAGIKQIPD